MDACIGPVGIIDKHGARVVEQVVIMTLQAVHTGCVITAVIVLSFVTQITSWLKATVHVVMAVSTVDLVTGMGAVVEVSGFVFMLPTMTAGSVASWHWFVDTCASRIIISVMTMIAFICQGGT